MNQQQELSALCKAWKQLPDKVVARDLMASHRHALTLALTQISVVPHARLGQKAPLNLTLQAGNGRGKVWILFLLKGNGRLKFASVKCWGPTAPAKERFHTEQSVGTFVDESALGQAWSGRRMDTAKIHNTCSLPKVFSGRALQAVLSLSTLISSCSQVVDTRCAEDLWTVVVQIKHSLNVPHLDLDLRRHYCPSEKGQSVLKSWRWCIEHPSSWTFKKVSGLDSERHKSPSPSLTQLDTPPEE